MAPLACFDTHCMNRPRQRKNNTGNGLHLDNLCRQIEGSDFCGTRPQASSCTGSYPWPFKIPPRETSRRRVALILPTPCMTERIRGDPNQKKKTTCHLRSELFPQVLCGQVIRFGSIEASGAFWGDQRASCRFMPHWKYGRVQKIVMINKVN